MHFLCVCVCVCVWCVCEPADNVDHYSGGVVLRNDPHLHETAEKCTKLHLVTSAIVNPRGITKSLWKDI